MEDISQPLVRAGRNDMSSPVHNHFVIVFNLDTFSYMYTQCYDQTEDPIQVRILTKTEKTELAINNLMEFLILIALNQGCVHFRLASYFGNHNG